MRAMFIEKKYFTMRLSTGGVIQAEFVQLTNENKTRIYSDIQSIDFIVKRLLRIKKGIFCNAIVQKQV